MKTRAIRANIGDWIYYVSTLTFKEVKDFVSPINEELHKSKTLSDMLQRTLTTNADSIKRYIINQKERFFNALVLAVYDGAPNWHEVELDFDGNDSFFNLGLLEFSGSEKIFPVDGQHRVEGIKRALAEKPELGDEEIPVIFIAHKNTEDGMRRSRRLFSTLNRYAKPVKLSDIIALDEDDSVAIITRELMIEMPLFADKRIINPKQKAIPPTNQTAFTNIISLYECNTELLKLFLQLKFNLGKMTTKTKIDEYCRFRREESEIAEYKKLVFDFWQSLAEKVDVVAKYLEKSVDSSPASELRNANGGHLLFRPVGQKPFVNAAISLYLLNGNDWSKAMNKLNEKSCLGRYSKENKNFK